MPYTTPTPWLHSFVLSSTMDRAGRRSEFYRAARSGQFLRLAQGVFIASHAWSSLTPDEQFLARIHAVALSSRPHLVFSHHSAAALWRLPIVGRWPSKPEVTVGMTGASPSRLAFTARQFPVPDEREVIDGLLVTGLARTVIDVGRTAPLSTSVAMMDRALVENAPGGSLIVARTTAEVLSREFGAITSARGRARCRTAIEIADGRSGSPGESLSRVGMHLLGLPMPVLQQPFYDADGLIGSVDFWWPEFNLIGEFDGNGKYLRDELLGGRTPAEVVIDEKRREDRLRALGPRVTRWGWGVAHTLPLLAQQLASAGLR